MQTTLLGIRKACPICGGPMDDELLGGLTCVRCDKIAGDAATEVLVAFSRAGR